MNYDVLLKRRKIIRTLLLSYQVVIGCLVQTNDLLSFLLVLYPEERTFRAMYINVDCNDSQFKHDDTRRVY